MLSLSILNLEPVHSGVEPIHPGAETGVLSDDESHTVTIEPPDNDGNR